MTDRELFERVASDPYAKALGIELLELRADYCRAALTTLTAEMDNFHGAPNGGAVFSLADFAFSGACNSQDEQAVGLTVSIQFVAAPQVGQRLIGEARATRQGKRAGFYEMSAIEEASGALIAMCQAVSLRTRPTS